VLLTHEPLEQRQMLAGTPSLTDAQYQARLATLNTEQAAALSGELLSNVVFVRRESGGVLQDSVGEDSSLDDERELMACVEASPATCR